MVALLRQTVKQSRIGLDLSATAVRAVQLRRAGDRWLIADLVETRRQAAPAAEDAAATSQWILECVERGAFKGRRVVASLCPPDIELHAIELPNLATYPQDELDDIIHWEIKRLASPALEEIETAHWPIPHGTGRAPNVIGIAAAQSTVSRLTTACQLAGFECTRIDVHPAALTRAGLHLHAFGPSDIWGVLELGARQSRLVLCLGETPVLARSAGPGGQTWSKRIADEMKLSEDAAEVHKCDHGIAPSARGVRQSGEGQAPSRELAAMLFAVLRPTLAKLVEEIERSYSYVLSCYPKGRAADLILCGGGACMAGLVEYLGKHLGIPVRRPGDYLKTPTCRLMVDGGGRVPLEHGLAAVGLALEASAP
ncbi:MAG: hypothetical protein C4547_06955 [Phycisphaerales bacterium]|nr:MAG: hypothetical protein C4547_06955 [Phycisphaerales bacterium]